MTLTVSEAATFVDDLAATGAVTKAIAETASVPVTSVSVTLELQGGSSRRLAVRGDPQRRLEDTATVVVSYEILVSADEPDGTDSLVDQILEALNAAAEDTAMMTDKLMEAIATEVGGESYTIVVVSMSNPSEAPAPTDAPDSSDPSLPAPGTIDGALLRHIVKSLSLMSMVFPTSCALLL